MLPRFVKTLRSLERAPLLEFTLIKPIHPPSWNVQRASNRNSRLAQASALIDHHCEKVRFDAASEVHPLAKETTDEGQVYALADLIPQHVHQER